MSFPNPRLLAGADIAALGMPRSRAAALAGVAAAVVADPKIFACGRELERGRRGLARAAGHRRMDGAIYRDASIARA